MKPRQFIVLILSIIAVGLGAYLAITVVWQPPPPPPPVDPVRLISAVDRFARERKAEGLPIPASMTLRELVTAGFLTTNEVVAFDGMEVTFLPRANLSNPREVMIRVRMQDGSQMVLLADGSVERLPK